MHKLINAFNVIQVIIEYNNLMKIHMDNVYARMVIMIIIKITVYVRNVIIVGRINFF